MPFIRLSDNYIDHPKFLALSDRAFRLWHEGMAFCRKHQTDGVIPISTLQGFRYYRAGAVIELATPFQPAAVPLWEPIEGLGYKIHDYLFWNLSKEEEHKERNAATARMRKFRKTQRDSVGDVGSDAVTEGVTNTIRAAFVQDMDMERSCISFPERESEGKPVFRRPGESIAYVPIADELQERAARLVERYGELFTQQRLGAKYRSRPNLDYEEAKTLVPLWDDARLEKLAILVLTTDDPWISRTDRSFKIFAMKATWADDKLRAWETEHGVVAV